MFEPENPVPKTVRQDKVFFIAFACLVIGFVGGIAFSIYQMPEAASSRPTADRNEGLSPEQQRVLESLEGTVEDDPENVQAWTQLGHLYFDTDQYDQAIKAYKRSLEFDPDNADVITDLGVMYRRNDQPEKAVDAFERAIAIDREHETARFNMGVVLLHDFEDKDAAIKVWEELVEINPVAYAPNGRLVAELLADLRQSS